MRVAVREAAALALPGDAVLLAPAAASLDMFTDYAQRGRSFAAAVGELHGGQAQDDLQDVEDRHGGGSER
jgi:UDP-N-acetylmuramoylalanine--D-glutamate ligase